MEKRDYYEVLNVSRDSSLAVIKKAYRTLAMKYHPDKNPGDKNAEEKFKEAAEAYEVLGNSEKRELYNQYGHSGLKDTGFSGFSNFEDIFSSFGDIFGDFFGFQREGGRNQSRARQGSDLRYNLEIEFLDAAFGVEKEITYEREVFCKSCSGVGHPKDASKVQCPMCGGQGQVISAQGFFRISRTCPNCRGEGYKVDKTCEDCRGKGRVKINQEIKINIPAGIESGQPVLKPGLGDEGINGGGAGDLYVVVYVAEHEFYKRDSDNIYSKVPISFTQAALGAEKVIQTIHGDKKFKIPQGTQTGEVYRMKGLGIDNIRTGNKGNHYVEVLVKTPTQLTEKARELFLELAMIQGEDYIPGEKDSIFEKIGDAFNKFISPDKESKKN